MKAEVLLRREEERWRLLQRDPLLSEAEARLLVWLHERGIAGFRRF